MSIQSRKNVASLIRPEIRALKAYHVPDASGLVKLDAMENPYSWPEDVRREWMEVLQGVALNRYPDPDARRLRERLRSALDVPAGMELILGNGSDELIQTILMAVSNPNAVVLAPTPTFVMYEMIATFTGMKFVGVPLQPDFSLDRPAMLKAIETHKPAVIFLAYPNNPTGNLFSREDVARVIEASPGLVVLDEAYHAFAGHSFMDRLGKHDNLLVMRTLSKQGLAGLRLGILAGPAAVAGGIQQGAASVQYREPHAGERGIRVDAPGLAGRAGAADTPGPGAAVSGAQPAARRAGLAQPGQFHLVPGREPRSGPGL